MHHSENITFSRDDILTVVHCKDQFWQDRLSQTYQPNCPAGMGEDALSGSDISKGQTEHKWFNIQENLGCRDWALLSGANRDGDQHARKQRLTGDRKSGINADTHMYVVCF